MKAPAKEVCHDGDAVNHDTSSPLSVPTDIPGLFKCFIGCFKGRYYYPLLIDDKINTQKGKVTCPYTLATV